MMSFPGQPSLVPPVYSAQPTAEDPGCDPGVPLRNLSMVRTRMDSLQCFLTESINADALISTDQMDSVSAAITTAIHDIISNGAALLSYSQIPMPVPDPTRSPATSPGRIGAPEVKNEEEENNDDGGEGEIVEVDAVELLAEHIHYCEICGKGFKRDANLRMHMRAHGNQFKTPEALAKPESKNPAARIHTRFSCPYAGCNRNKTHGKFRALKSVVCVKNHFKRSHCPKMYSCNRCNKKSFSVVADLKSHLKHCGGEARWRCTCGTSFSRKTKLFGHMALFEGHMPAVEDDKTGAGAETNNAAAMMDRDEEEEEEEVAGTTAFKGGEWDSNVFEDMEFSGELLDGFGSIDGYFLQDMLVDL